MEGDLAARRATVLRDGVECPALSPDGTRIAFKQKTSANGADLPTWQPAVLDLTTLKDHPLAETRTVDDQIEWLDNSTVVYAVDTGIGAPSIYADAGRRDRHPRPVRRRRRLPVRLPLTDVPARFRASANRHRRRSRATVGGFPRTWELVVFRSSERATPEEELT